MSFEEKPLVSIIVPSKDEEQYISKCIDSLLSQTYPEKEIIVINDGSTDSTWKILKRYGEKIKVIEKKGVGPSRARNEAIENASGSFIAFTDADCIAEKDWIEQLIGSFDKDTYAVGGVQKAPEDSADFSLGVHAFFKTFGFVSDYFHGGKKIREVEHNPTCNVMYRKEIFELNGKFREDLWPCEDLEFDIRLRKKGLVLKLNPQAVVYHYRPQRLWEFAIMMFRYGEAHGKLNGLHGFTQKIHFLPLIITLIVAGGILTRSISSDIFHLSTTIVLSAFLGFVFVRNLRVRRTVKVLGLFLVAIIFWNLGFFINSAPEFRKTLGI